MKKTQTVLVNLALHFETPVQEDDDQTDDRAHRFSLRALEVLEKAFADDSSFAGYFSFSHSPLDHPSINAGQCSRCGQWTTDREASSPLRELCNGARIDGQLLCDDCLPADHRWAFLPGRNLEEP